MKSSKMKKCMDLSAMKQSLSVKTHIKAGPSDISPRYGVVVDPGQGYQHKKGSGWL